MKVLGRRQAGREEERGLQSGAGMGNASPGEGGRERGWEMLGIKVIQRPLPRSL